MLNDRVRSGEHQAGVTVVETHQVGRVPARSADLNDLARPLRLAHEVATHVEPVPDGCLHRPTSLPAFRATRAQQDTLTVRHIASIYLVADGWYWLCVGTARQAADVPIRCRVMVHTQAGGAGSLRAGGVTRWGV